MQDVRLAIRKDIRQQRNALSSFDQVSAAKQLLAQLKFLPKLNHAKNIALYLSVDGELDTKPVIEYLWEQGKHVFLPVLHPFSKGHLLFLRYEQNTVMTLNAFRIPEPKLHLSNVIPMAQLDIIFTPLVAFDANGNRLGMGGGYYDRSLAHWHKTGEGAIPIGIAHNCQQIAKVPTESWDIPLPFIATPSKIWKW
ncbi:5-formyltetrahydrofolate cyclo-ligase [Vibrio sp. TH_r3]|uniref:5-formyltetrahydrofolate cyclo-ligase n=1 Tax=Vibrio sp. TH_r3 TaxID=3082084 RepID=UPI002955CDE9|nr:5-formyltetrahydrofolate cyclo-ligase [Vibrio sp. TH_r3]MDV7106263.1 5-formyltetrahydrofolate cyclo-ligase [Vibrio sp. TH_r3]